MDKFCIQRFLHMEGLSCNFEVAVRPKDSLLNQMWPNNAQIIIKTTALGAGGRSITYCGGSQWVRPMEVKRWPKQIPGMGFMDYRYKEEDYLVRHVAKQAPSTIGTALDCIRQTAMMLGKKQGYTPESIVIENRW